MEVALKIGIAGTGRMGAAMATRLLACAHSLSVWNRTAQKTEALAKAGANVAATPRELTTPADVVITMRPEVEKALAHSVKERGAALIECPVGGTVGPAKEGKLFGFVGGEAADVERARPLLNDLCRRVEHVGAIGAGASVKLAINLPLLVYYQVLGEALSLCRDVDIDPARLIDIFADTSGGPNMLKVRGATIAAALHGKETAAVTFDVNLVRKDMRTMLDEAAGLSVRLPLTAHALERYDEAARNGLGASDATMLPAFWLRHGQA